MAGGELNGRAAIVTGAASGIGAAVAARLRDAGAKVAAIDAADGAGVWIRADVTSDAAVAGAVEEARTQIGPMDIVVHAAAASVPGGVLDTPPETWARLYDVNVLGAVRLLRATVPDMRDRGGGAVLLFSSINARFATPSLAAYAATKSAVDSLTRTAALEFAADGIRVNAIAPASVDTPLLRASFEREADPAEARSRNIARHPLGRLGLPEDVSELALFLLSDRSSWITGAVYPIDGGAGVARR